MSRDLPFERPLGATPDGVRVEDIVTVTGDGGQRFNDVTRELQLVE